MSWIDDMIDAVAGTKSIVGPDTKQNPVNPLDKASQRGDQRSFANDFGVLRRMYEDAIARGEVDSRMVSEEQYGRDWQARRQNKPDLRN